MESCVKTFSFKMFPSYVLTIGDMCSVSVLSCSLINITNDFMMRIYEDHHNDTSTVFMQILTQP